MLLVILMSQLEVRAPDQEIAPDNAQILSNLLQEVQSQKGRIEQLTGMLGSPKRQYPRNPGMHFEIGSQSARSDASWDLEEPNSDLIPPPRMPMHAMSNPRTAPQIPSRAASSAARAIPKREPAPSVLQNDQVAITAQALESWGNKRVSWGKTHNGSRYAEVYEQFPDYLTWITARANSANAAMQDFIMYIQARESLEHQALSQV